MPVTMISCGNYSSSNIYQAFQEQSREMISKSLQVRQKQQKLSESSSQNSEWNESLNGSQENICNFSLKYFKI